jgi:hypothetical protein
MVGIALGLVAACSLAAAVVARRPLAERAIVAALAARGVAPAAVEVARLGVRGAELRALRVGDPAAPDLEIASVALAWSRRGLVAGRLDRVEVERPRLRLRFGPEGLEAGALAPLLAGEGEGGGLVLPFAEAQLREVEIALEAPAGSLTVRGDAGAKPEGTRVALAFDLLGASERGTLQLGGEGEVDLATGALRGEAQALGETPWGHAEGELAATGSLADLRVAFEATALPRRKTTGVVAAEPLALAGTAERRAADGALAWTARATAKEITRPELARVEGLAIDAQGTGGDAVRAKLQAQRVTLLGEEPFVSPVSLDATLAGSLERLAVTATARTAGDGLAFDFDGALQPLLAKADLRVRVPPTDIAAKDRQPARVFPWLRDVVLRAKGTAGADGRLRLADGRLDAEVTLALRDVDVSLQEVTLRRVNGAVTVRGPEPLETPPGQLVSIALVEGALPLADGLVQFELTRSGISGSDPGIPLLVVEHTEWGFAGGKLRGAGRLPLAAEERSLALEAEGLDVATLLGNLDVSGLSGTGKLAGRIPLRQLGERVVVEAGELHATGPGVLRYAPSEGARALGKEYAHLAVLLGALEDLRYEVLTLTLNGDTAGDMQAQVHVRGRNPNFQEGRPVVLNVNVEAQLAALVKSGVAAYRVPAAVEERVQRVLERREKP